MKLSTKSEYACLVRSGVISMYCLPILGGCEDCAI